MNRKLVPDGFQVPELLENERVRLRMLTGKPSHAGNRMIGSNRTTNKPMKATQYLSA
jgi:hypothetical protein